MKIELLEQRIAPAAVLNFTDMDGDHVKITASKGPLDAGDLHFAASGRLDRLDLTDAGFAGANITISVAKAGGGDGLVNVGHIDATGIDLGAVKVKGDLGRIHAGDGTFTTPGLKRLSVGSIGFFDTTMLTGGNLRSYILGSLGALAVADGVYGGSFDVSGALGSVTLGGSLVGTSQPGSGLITSGDDMGPVKIAGDVRGGAGGSSGLIYSDGNLASLTIGGSLLGGSGNSSGWISAQDRMGPVKIGHDVIGGNGNNSGNIMHSGPKLDSVTIGGSLLGGSGDDSGRIGSDVGDVGAVKIGADVKGGAGAKSGQIFSENKLGGVTIGGSLIGGGGTGSGGIVAEGNIGPVKIGGDLQGGSVGGFASTDRTGYIEGARIASVTIGGSILAGTDNSFFGTLTHSGAILAADDLGPIVVKGFVAGNVSALGTTLVNISARGHAGATGASDVALASLTVGGDVTFAKIQAGVIPGGRGQNADAQIGAVKVGGDWTASQLLAGVEAGTDGKFGTLDDDKLSGDYGAGPVKDGEAISRIASIVIGGRVLGTASPASDHFGFVAEQIGRITIGGKTEALKAGPGNNFVLGIDGTDDVSLIEAPVPF